MDTTHLVAHGFDRAEISNDSAPDIVSTYLSDIAHSPEAAGLALSQLLGEPILMFKLNIGWVLAPVMDTDLCMYVEQVEDKLLVRPHDDFNQADYIDHFVDVCIHLDTVDSCGMVLNSVDLPHAVNELVYSELARRRSAVGKIHDIPKSQHDSSESDAPPLQ